MLAKICLSLVWIPYSAFGLESLELSDRRAVKGKAIKTPPDWGSDLRLGTGASSVHANEELTLGKPLKTNEEPTSGKRLKINDSRNNLSTFLTMNADRPRAPTQVSVEESQTVPVLPDNVHQVTRISPKVIGASFQGQAKACPNLIETSTYVLREILGVETLRKIMPTLNDPDYQSPQYGDFKNCIVSHSVKSIVSYIDVANRALEPPLYITAEELVAAQRTAIHHVQQFWQGRADEDSPFFPSQVKKKIMDKYEPPGSKAIISNRIVGLMFLMWIKQNFPPFYLLCRARKSEYAWNNPVIQVFNKYLMSARTSQKVIDQVKIIGKSSPVEEIMTYRMTDPPFKILRPLQSVLL